MEEYKKNKPAWVPTEDDYRLIFREVDERWVEITGNIPRFKGMTLAEYLDMMGLVMNEGTAFCRIITNRYVIEYRDFHSYVRIDIERAK